MTTKLSQPVYEMIQTLLDVRNTLEDLKIETRSMHGMDAKCIEIASVESIAAIDSALDIIKYTE